ncbi:MAG: hypothetical protein ACOYKC_02940 [Anaerolineaceae bacterium]|jgi:hypothetical protein
MNKKFRVYKSLATVLFMILIIAACTPISNQSNSQESPTSTLAEITPTVIDTKTSTPTQEATETNTPTPTEVPEKYPIDIEKLSNPPQSYEDFVNNLDKFVQAPSPDGSDENFHEFVTWYNETLFQKALGGDLEKLPVNYEVRSIDIGATGLSADSYGTKQERHSLPYFFYFKDRNGVPYPCYIVTVATPEYQQTFTVVGSESTRQLAPLLGMPDMITEVYQGTHSFSSLQLSFDKFEDYLDTEKYLVDQGFGGVPSTFGEVPIIRFGWLGFRNK